MVLASATRPEPKPQLDYGVLSQSIYDDQELREFINDDRKEGNRRLLITLLCVGAIIEVSAFLIVYYASQRIVEPVETAYDKQKLFIANASHELKTPLAVIQANMEALEVPKSSEKWKVNIETEINHAGDLVLNLLKLAKMDAGSTELAKPEEVNLEKEIKKHIEIFKPKSSSKLSFKNNSGSKPVSIIKQDFLQVVDILLDNAVKYGDKRISVTLNNGELRISNDGTKISKKDLDKIFDRFYQTDKTREGSGLGLAIAKAICDQNGWGIHCESSDKETIFTVVYK